MGNLFQELKRRKVFRVAAVYAVVAWLLIQVADVVLPTFGAPTWVNQTLIFLFIIGFPIAVILSWAYEKTPEGIKPDALVEATPPRQVTSAQPINYMILAIVLIVAGFQVADRVLLDSAPDNVPTRSNTEATTFRSELNLGNLELYSQGTSSITTFIDLSSDGSKLAYSAYQDGSYRIYLRDMNQLESQLLVDTQTPYFNVQISPDGEWIAYRSERGDLIVVSTPGGAPRTLTSLDSPNAFQWLDNESLIYFNENETNTGWYKIAVSNGGASLLVSTSEEDLFSTNPSLLPGDERILFTQSTNRMSASKRISLVDIATGIQTPLINDAYAPTYVPSGHIVFMRNDDLWAVPFDLESLQITGTERPVINGIENFGEDRASKAFYTVSEDGMLAYLPGSDVSGGNVTQLIWLDSSGNEEPLDLPHQIYQDPQISPDGRRLSIGIIQPEGTQDVWIHDLSRPGILNRITQSGNALNAIWTPDGQELIYTDVSTQSLWQTSASGTGIAEQIFDDQTDIFARSVSPTGDILFDRGWYTDTDIRLFQAQDVEMPNRPLLAEGYHERTPRISADGQLLAYQSTETGGSEIFVRPYPQVDDNKWRISANGGSHPRWDPTRSELHYITPEGVLVSVEIQLEPDFQVGQRREIPIQNYLLSNTPAFAVDPNAERFLFMKYVADEASRPARDGTEPVLVVLVHNWFEELNRLVPPDSQ